MRRGTVTLNRERIALKLGDSSTELGVSPPMKSFIMNNRS